MMFKQKKYSILLAALLILVNTTNSHAASFKDVPENTWYYEAIETMYKEGIVSGYGNGIFKPENKITHAEILRMLLNMAKIDTTQYKTNDSWYSEIENWINLNTDIRIDDYLTLATRNDIAEYIVKIYNLERTKEENHFVDTENEFANILFDHNITAGINTEAGLAFEGDSNLTRGQSSVFLLRLMDFEVPKYEFTEEIKAQLEFKSSREYHYYKSFIDEPTKCETIEDMIYIWKYMAYNDIYEFEIIAKNNDRYTLETISNIKEDMKTSYRIANREMVEFIPMLGAYSLNSFFVDDRGYYSEKKATDNIKIKFAYHPDEEIIKEQKAYLKAESNKILDDLFVSGKLTNNMNNKEKAYVLFEYLINRLEYDYSYQNYDAYLALINNSATCQGYTGAYNYLLHLLNIPAKGTGNPSHIWTKVEENGEIYHTDVTWGDGKYTSGKTFINTDWFWTIPDKFPKQDSHMIDIYG